VDDSRLDHGLGRLGSSTRSSASKPRTVFMNKQHLSADNRDIRRFTESCARIYPCYTESFHIAQVVTTIEEETGMKDEKLSPRSRPKCHVRIPANK